MAIREMTIAGTLKPDGTLELDQRPTLSPGRVTVVLRQETEAVPPDEDWWQYLQRCRRELEASGAKFMNEEEVNAYMDWLREPDQIDELLRQTDEQSQQRKTL
jgi:hypothetical protein